jgi:phage terminase large subunit-like protein
MTPRPFTLPHFRAWTDKLSLDTGGWWALEPFQAAFVRDVFTGVPEAWLVIGEGNGKTTLIAALALYHAEHRQDAAVMVAASSRDQAEVMYRQAEGFIERSDLQGFRCHPGYRRIAYAGRRSRIQVFAADDRTGDGIIPTLCLLDELHRHRDLRLYRTWRGKLDKRAGQMIAISTAGEPGSEFEQARERIRQDGAVTRRSTFVRAVTPSVILHEWAVPEGGDVEDIRLVKRANPLKAVTTERLRAKLEAPTMTLAHWRRFVCNIATRSDDAAITEAEWESAKTDEHIPEGIPIWLGLDVAWKWDTTAIVPYWYRDDDFRLLGPAIVLVPPRDGRSLDPALVERALTEIHARNPIHTVVMDPTRAEQLAEWISRTFGSTVIERGQTSTFAVVDFERFMEGLRGDWLKHTGDEALTRHALNAVARIDRFGASRFDRSMPGRMSPDAERRVIDALVAAAMVNAQASAPVEAPSVYEDRPMVAL